MMQAFGYNGFQGVGLPLLYRVCPILLSLTDPDHIYLFRSQLGLCPSQTQVTKIPLLKYLNHPFFILFTDATDDISH